MKLQTLMPKPTFKIFLRIFLSEYLPRYDPRLPKHRVRDVLKLAQDYSLNCLSMSLECPNANARLFDKLISMSLRCPRASARLFTELLKHELKEKQHLCYGM